MRAVDKDVVWFHCGFLPLRFGFTRSEKAYYRWLKRLRIANSDDFHLHDSAATTHIMRQGDGQLPRTVVIVTQRLDRKNSRAQTVATLTHEAVHVWQTACEAMRQEGKAGDEVEAYAVQYFTQCMVGEIT